MPIKLLPFVHRAPQRRGRRPRPRHPRGGQRERRRPRRADEATRAGGGQDPQARRVHGKEGPDRSKSPAPIEVKPARLLLIGLGKEPLGEVEVRLFAAKAGRFAASAKASSLALQVPASVSGGERAAAEGVVLGSYRFTKYLTGDRVPKVKLDKVTLLVEGKLTKEAKDAAAVGQQVGEAICIARDLINEPPNELYPEKLADAAVAMCKSRGLQVTVLDRPALEKKGMKLIIAVGRGSRRDPRMIHMVYKPKGANAKTKKNRLRRQGPDLRHRRHLHQARPGHGRDEGRHGRRRQRRRAHGRRRGGQAQRRGPRPHRQRREHARRRRLPPRRHLRLLDGKTVEIINTDAEGRLVLADALAYGRELKPDLMVDNATLTGACVVALGPTVSGYFANRDEAAERFRKAAKSAGEAMWQLPLVEDLRDGLKSDWADIKHVADRWGGSISAALFLREFVGETPWIHVDIAGPSMASKAYGIYSKGGTGQGVLTFLRVIDDLATS